MKTILLSIFLLVVGNVVFAFNDTLLTHNDSLFFYNEIAINKQFEEIEDLENIIIANPDTISYIVAEYDAKNVILNNTPLNPLQNLAPGILSSFWFTFVLSAIGTYTIYGIPAGPIGVTIVYFLSNGCSIETKRAIFGCIGGVIVGGAVKLLILNL